jgi:hypothetical protein
MKIELLRCNNSTPDPIGTDDPTQFYRIPGDGIASDSDGKMSIAANFISGVLSNTR